MQPPSIYVPETPQRPVIVIQMTPQQYETQILVDENPWILLFPLAYIIAFAIAFICFFYKKDSRFL